MTWADVAMIVVIGVFGALIIREEVKSWLTRRADRRRIEANRAFAAAGGWSLSSSPRETAKERQARIDAFEARSAEMIARRRDVPEET